MRPVVLVLVGVVDVDAMDITEKRFCKWGTQFLRIAAPFCSPLYQARYKDDFKRPPRLTDLVPFSRKSEGKVERMCTRVN